jgi:CRISPR system Cascade subunit CasC
MTRFLQLHILTPYPPSNPNRDDLGRPKTAILGGVTRMRISSQAIKRAIRTSDVFETALRDHRGQRTQRMGEVVNAHLIGRGVSEKRAEEIARAISTAFGKIKTTGVQTEQLAFISPEEREAALKLADEVAAGANIPSDKDLAKVVLRTADTAADIAMFGRMLADNPGYNRDAAVQVSHALTTNAVIIEDDYYTAVDDLKTRDEDAGAGFIGEAGFGAGIFYLYVSVDRDLLLRNLGGHNDLAKASLEALVRAVATASPSGKRNSFANHVKAEFILAELGDAQPRTLANAFLQPVGKGDQLNLSIERLVEKRSAFAVAYGRDWIEDLCLHVGHADSATLHEIATFAGKDIA